MFGISTSINVESENESTNDYRAGLEFAMLKNKLYLGAEVYYMNVGFTKRQKISESYNYLGGYVQGKQLHAMISSTVTEWTPMVF